ncbi:Alkali metal cation/H+ antiporter Nha1 C terminus domain containing protein [Elaphomyces granulatus]
MVWEQLSIDKPHVAYMVLGGFPALFMLCSLFVKEKLYIGEATVATVCGIIFGPYAANLFSPESWGNVDKITLECSRIVLVVQCFAIGVELPKAYMEKHWRSVFLLLVPVMTWGWLITGTFIWWMVPPLNWLESLACAACVTATDPVLASSVVGKGKFAKRIPRHLRDVLSAESGCNDGMSFPFVYLSLYLLRYRPDAKVVAFHWICYTILYECIFGAVYGFLLGYIARHAIKFAERKRLIDRESFLVFYFVLALFCAGSGSLLGMDDLLIGFSAGVGFSNDGWFTEKTEESHVSNVIDLLLNLTYFVYFGSIMPWSQFNAPDIGLYSWRLVVLAILVILFRRIPIVLMLKPIIPDIKTWREALFAGHFGPIGVGAIFACILARSDLENHPTQPVPLSQLPGPGDPNYYIVQLIWPITTFLVISSIVVHGSSIAVFTLGKRINTLTITLSYTTNEDGPSWMNRLPRMPSLSRSSLSFRKADSSEVSSSEGLSDFHPGLLPPIGIPNNFLRRVREEDDEITKRSSSLRPSRRRKRGAGGPITQSAIVPIRRSGVVTPIEGVIGDQLEDGEGTKEPQEGDRGYTMSSPLVVQDDEKLKDEEKQAPELEVYREGNDLVIEDGERNVIVAEDVSHMAPEQLEKFQKHPPSDYTRSSSREPEKMIWGERVEEPATAASASPTTVVGKIGSSYRTLRDGLVGWVGLGKKKERDGLEAGRLQQRRMKPGRPSAHAYQFGNTVIVEDEDGEVIKTYTIPPAEKAAEGMGEPLTKISSHRKSKGSSGSGGHGGRGNMDDDSDDGLRFRLAHDVAIREGGIAPRGRRMSKQDLIREISRLDPKARLSSVDDTHPRPRWAKTDDSETDRTVVGEESAIRNFATDSNKYSTLRSVARGRSRADNSGSSDLRRRNTNNHYDGDNDDEGDDDGSNGNYNNGNDSDDGLSRRRRVAGLPPRSDPWSDDVETPAERKRRLAALGEIDDPNDDDDDEEAELAGVPRQPRHAVASESDSEDDGEPRAVKGQVQFADGLRPAKRRGRAGEVSMVPLSSTAPGNHSGSGSASDYRIIGYAHRPKVSWGGEKGREF